MYYFEILDLLQGHKKKEFTAIEIYIEISKLHSVNINRLRDMLSKMSLSNKIRRRLVMLPIRTEFSRNPNTPTWVYYFE